MKDVKTSLFERTSVRRFTREPISDADMDFIYNAIRNTPTSYNGQQFSVIDITDQPLKERLAEITGQKQIKTCNHFLVFVSDYNKARLLAEAKGIDFPDITDTMDGTIIGVIDASLAMMSAIVAAQSLGLGSNCIGYLRTADPARIAEILNLPKGVFVVCGLAIGHPNESPDLKPKESAGLVIHKNQYRDDSSEMQKELLEYDTLVRHYNQTRSGHTTDNDWISHMVDYYREATKYQIKKYLADQGYDISR